MLKRVSLQLFLSSNLLHLTTSLLGVLGVSCLINAPALSQVNSGTNTYVTPEGIVVKVTAPNPVNISPDGSRIKTPAGLVTSTVPFQANQDGSYSTSSGTTVTPNGLIVTGDRQKIYTPVGSVTSDKPFSISSDGSFNAPGAAKVTPGGLLISPDGRQIITGAGKLTSDVGFTPRADGSFISSGGTIITPNGTLIIPNGEVIIPPRRSRHSQ
jgi:hypothetical protein